MIRVGVERGLSLPELPEGHRLLGILGSALGASPRGELGSWAHWPAAHFGLERVRVYREASAERRRAVLEHLGRSILEEAFFIEKLGTAFASKMALLAESTEERMLYALFAADEARHLAGVTRLLGGRAPSPDGQPFLALLERSIADCERTSLQFIVQVVLEGWGLAHYRGLGRATTSPEVTAVFEGILADEPRHHGSGLLLFNEGALSPRSTDEIADVVARFLELVRMGPQSVLAALEQELGLTRSMRLEVFQELEGEGHAALRLDLLHDLMTKARPAAGLVERFRAGGLFGPRAARECV